MAAREQKAPAKGLQKLEDALPGPLQKRALAVLLTLVVAAAAILGLGGIKLSRERSRTAAIFTEGAQGDGYSILYDLGAKAEAASTLVGAGEVRLGADDPAVTGARQALEGLQQALPGGSPAACYAANRALNTKMDVLAQAIGAKTDDKLGGTWAEYLSRDQIMDGDGYHEAARAFNKLRGSFPANVIAAVCRIPELERFA